MFHRSGKIAFFAALLLGVSLTAGAQELLQNGGFEQGNFAPNS